MIIYLRATLHFSTHASLMASLSVPEILLLYYFTTFLAMYYTSSVEGVNELDESVYEKDKI